MGNKTPRNRYTAVEKIEILKRHLVGGENVADICDSIGLQTNQFYRWQSELFCGAKVVFEQKKGGRKQSREMKTIRKIQPQSLAQIRDVVGRYNNRYNNDRLHNAIGYIAPADKMHGKTEKIYKEREQKLQQARDARKELNKAD